MPRRRTHEPFALLRSRAASTTLNPGVALKLNHANFCSSDVPALSAVFARHFDFKVLQIGKVPEISPQVHSRPAPGLLRCAAAMAFLS